MQYFPQNIWRQQPIAMEASNDLLGEPRKIDYGGNMVHPIGYYLEKTEGTIAEQFSQKFGDTGSKLNDRERFFLIASIASHAYVKDKADIGNDLIQWATTLKNHPDMNDDQASCLIEFLSSGMNLRDV